MKPLRSDRPINITMLFFKAPARYFYKAASYFCLFIALILSMGVSTSCKNKIEDILSLSLADTLALESATDIEVIYSDSGRVQAILRSPLMNKYQEDAALLIFPEGFELVFYDSAMAARSVITARYGKIDEKNNTMEAQNNVVVINRKKNEQLDTEHLVWDQKKGIIYSDVFVKISTPDEVIYGNGLTSDQNFESYTITNPSGEFTVEQDEL